MRLREKVSEGVLVAGESVVMLDDVFPARDDVTTPMVTISDCLTQSALAGSNHHHHFHRPTTPPPASYSQILDVQHHITPNLLLKFTFPY